MAEKGSGNGAAAKVGVLGALTAFLLKFKAAIFGILKIGWLFKASWSMFLSLGIYAMAFGWQWALVVIGLIFIHEMGHWLFMKVAGLDPKAPVFIPLMGAYVAMSKLPDSPVLHAWVAFAGPLVGGLAAGALYALGMKTDSNFLISAASWGFIINLLQLVPVRPFDGGFISECLSRWLAIPGIIILALVAWQWHSPLLIVIIFVSVMQTIKRFRDGTAAYTLADVTPLQKVEVATAYFGLAGTLGYLYSLAHAQLSPMLPQ